MTREIESAEQLDELLDASENLVVLDFRADWCQPCEMLEPELHDALDSIDEDVTLAEVDIDEAPDLARSFDVGSIPAVLFFRDGEECHRFVGVKQSAEIVEMVHGSEG